MHYSTNIAAAGRELHHAINPGLAEFDRLARKPIRPKPVFTRGQYDEREIFRARARAIIERSLKGGF